MDIYKAIKLVMKNFWLLAILPMISAGLVIFMTRNEAKEYVSRTVIFTGITSGHSIESQGRDRIDFFAVNASFDNMLNILKSKSVLEEVSLRLLAKNLMLNAPHPRHQSKESHDNLKEITPAEVWALVVEDDFEATLQALTDFKNKDEVNHLYKLINLTHPHYSIKALSRLTARRVQGSDLLEINYRANDPAIVYQTLLILTDVFFDKQSTLKMSQTNTVVDYFIRQLDIAWAKLDEEERKLLEYNEDKKIINYFEQTKHVASQQESIDLAIQQALMDISSSRSMLLRLENDIAERMNVNLKTQNIMFLRNALVSVNERLERLTVEYQDAVAIETISELLTEKQQLEDRIRSTVDSLFRIEKNIDGVERDLLIERWHNNVLGLESSSARYEVLSKRRIEYDTLYNYYAPVGANLNRMERTIGVYEREYLNILHSLGLAKLRQQNLELSSTMDILDPPYLPIEAQPSKRKLFIAVAFIFTFVFIIAGIFIMALLDRNMRTVDKLKKTTGLEVAGAVLDEVPSKTINIPLLAQRAIAGLAGQLLHRKQQKPEIPFIINVFSHWLNEGKTFYSSKLKTELQRLNYSVGLVQIGEKDEQTELPEGTWLISELLYHKSKSFKDWCSDDYLKNCMNYDFLIIEIPQLSAFTLNPRLCNDADINHLLVTARRTWSPADDTYLGKLKALSVNNLEAVLNQISPDNIEEYIGDIPKKRSFIRRAIKNKLFKRYIGMFA
jgi:succinoglycan biosynthesis transport protein ExoP